MLLPSLSTHLAAKAWLLFAHGPLVSAIPLFSSVGPRQGGLPPSFLLGASWLRAQRQPALGQGVVATRWGQGAQALCRQQEGGRLHPAALHFYELQREAKFPQPPNETESKSELIGNRQEGGKLEDELRPVQG